MMRAGIYQPPKIERIIFGKSYLEAVRELVDELGAQRVFVIASRTLNRQTALVRNLRDALGARHCGTFDEVPAHTPREAVVQAANRAREAGADLLVCFGGGSQTDAAKVIQLCLSNDVREVADLDALRASAGRARYPKVNAPNVRTVAIPTTMSAGEFNAYAGVSNRATGVKESFHHRSAVPAYVVLDPAVTLATPAELWLSTGIRALDHAVEGYLSIDAQPFSQAADLQVLRLLPEALRRCQSDPGDLQARFDCQMAMWLSTVGSQSGVNKGASHAIGHILGSWAGVPHGITSCVTLPSVLRYNAEVNYAEQAIVAQTLGAPNDDPADFIEKLIADLGLPTRLSQVGVSADRLEELAALCMHDRWIPTNPRPLPDATAVLEILKLAA
jgi:maleylacetate reductase